MPLVVNRKDPKGSSSKANGASSSSGKSPQAPKKSGAKKAAENARHDRLRVVALSIVIVAAVCAIAWYFMGTRKATEPVIAQKQGATSTPAALRSRRTSGQPTSAIGSTPGLPAPVLPGGAQGAGQQAPARADQPAETPQEPSEGIH